ncbi:AraC family transcriptional regulator [Serratia odorifera]|uniref:Transcriptional regulator, AraC family n=2 Tax=Serratia odorifera TaxID=618 RepID=D4E4M3_SEROD|nr:AraC family transcriptional regulator [Serratia odorifera]EFE95432.1 transcriptional regulator, AraC family [Serratia odorifera DSM 4582]PNK89971.1 AraC family transcriptional regulator [Serratia odorifera]RII71154.1 AraC family transcriptional regulator [Serratia odorifera]VDZ61432.1 Methylphosphotriester-DNA--protein-cysteine S-methyltransferase [Serratia odorifera]
MAGQNYLERIALNERFISFNRMNSGSANYFHWHQCLEMLFVSRGYGIAIVDNQQYTLRPGRLFIFPPFKLHKVFVEQNDANHYHRTTLHLEHTVIEHFLQPFPQRRAQFQRLCYSQSNAFICDLADCQLQVETVLDRFNQRYLTGSHQLEDVAFLALEMMAFLPEKEGEALKISQGSPARIMQWVEENYQHKFSLAHLAADLGRSKSYLSRLFSRETGSTIQEYLLTRRVKRACELLRSSDLAIGQIAAAVGFADAPYFISCFKKMLGQTPLQYRKGATGLGD